MHVVDPGLLAAVFGAQFVAHQVADHWLQTSHQATNKGRAGWVGRRACAAHVIVYTAVSYAMVAGLGLVAGWSPSLTGWAAGLGLSAITHYIADRRTPLLRIATVLGRDGFYHLGAERPGRDDNKTLGTGAYALDQSWHYFWLWMSSILMVALP